MKNGKYGISDVAEMLGVSKSTVSRVINGNEGVGPELRKKVMDFINEIGYQPNTIAQSLSKGRMNIVALILGDIRNPFYADLTFNIQRILNDNGYMVMVLNSEYNIDRELEFLKLTEQFNFAGLILITAQEKAIEERLKNMEMPKVLVNRILPYYTGDSVLIDNFQAGYQATMHLIELGHRHIGFIKGPGVSSASSQRFAGYRQVLENYGFSFDEKCVFESDLKLETGRALAQTNRPESLDPALTRPGRFDRRVPVELPDLEGREAILKVHAKKVQLSDDVDFHTIARMASGASGAELANIVNEAALRAVRDNREVVTEADLEESIEVVIAGYQKKNAVLSDQEKRVVAICLPAGRFNFCVRSIRAGIADILPHRIIKQEHILIHHRNLV